MKPFMDKDFLLRTETAKHLFHTFAENLPIYDYHCHISPREIWENIGYDNITQVWLYGDHYKWRIMRAVGIDEKYITGGASDYDKFVAYTKALSMAIGNPLYHWSHLELRRYFGIEEILCEENAPVIWEKSKAALQKLRCQDLIRMSNVSVIVTTDDPADSLEYHRKLREEKPMQTRVVPGFRPDKVLAISADGFCDSVRKLADVSGHAIENFQDLKEVLHDRIEFFHENGCRVSDHGLTSVPFVPGSEDEADQVLRAALSGKKPSEEEQDLYRTAVLIALAEEYARHGWVMQLHMAALRNNNTVLIDQIGPDVGNDAMTDAELGQNLARLMDAMNRRKALPKTVLYSLNPAHNYVLLTIGGCFAGEVPGKIQLGSAWWFNDHIDGIREQLKTVANAGVLGQFIGMLTDSRSFLSYFRHEYFRRILCDLIGEWVENGEYPYNEADLKKIITAICYNNAVSYFGIEI